EVPRCPRGPGVGGHAPRGPRQAAPARPVTRTRSAPLFLVPPKTRALRCAICHRALPLDPLQLVIVIRGLWSGFACGARCAAVALGPAWSPPVGAPLLEDGAVLPGVDA